MSFVNVKEYNKLVARVTELQARVQALETFHQGEPVAEKKAEPIHDIEEAIEEENLTDGSSPLEDLFGTKIALLLIGADLDSIEMVRAASNEQFLAINGIGGTSLSIIREMLEE